MTKQDEKNALRAFIESLPKSCYLRDILADCENEIRDCITNDICFLSFSERIEEQRAHIREIGEMQNRLSELQRECRAEDTRLAKLRISVDNVRSEIRILAQSA